MSSADFCFDPSNFMSPMVNLIKLMRKSNIECGGLQLYTTKLEKVIQNLSPCSLEEIGSTSWMKKINAIIMVINGLDDIPEVGKKLLFQHKKVGVFVRDMITVNIWIQDLLPQFIEKINAKSPPGVPSLHGASSSGKEDGGFECRNTTLMLAYHGLCCTTLVTYLMRDDNFITSLEHTDLKMDIIDHAISVLQNFIAKKPAVDPNLDTDGDKSSKTYQLAYEEAKLNMVSLFRLALNLFQLPSNTVVKLLHPSTRLVATMVDLIMTRPWEYISQATPDFNFLNFVPSSSPNSSPIIVRFDPIETMSWQILIEVLVPKPGESVKLLMAFPVVDECARKLSLLKELLKVKSFVESMPGSYELKIFLAQVEFVPAATEVVTATPLNRTMTVVRVESSLGPPIIKMNICIEHQPPPSPFHEALRVELVEKKKAILDIHEAMGPFERRKGTEGHNRLDRVMEALWKDMNQYCFKCGKADAKLRCSRCKFAWYCDRKCQSKDWTKHKQECKVIMQDVTYELEYNDEDNEEDQAPN